MEYLLKSRVGAFEIKRRTKIEHERGTTYEFRPYVFSAENDFKASMPVDVWEELKDKLLDKDLLYRDALTIIG